MAGKRTVFLPPGSLSRADIVVWYGPKCARASLMWVRCNKNTILVAFLTAGLRFKTRQVYLFTTGLRGRMAIRFRPVGPNITPARRRVISRRGWCWSQRLCRWRWSFRRFWSSKPNFFVHLGRETAQKRLKNGWINGFSELPAARAVGARMTDAVHPVWRRLTHRKSRPRESGAYAPAVTQFIGINDA